MPALQETPADPAELRTALQQVADALGVPVETFTNTADSDEHELLRLWYALSNEKRKRLLEKAREMADHPSAPDA